MTSPIRFTQRYGHDVAEERRVHLESQRSSAQFHHPDQQRGERASAAGLAAFGEEVENLGRGIGTARPSFFISDFIDSSVSLITPPPGLRYPLSKRSKSFNRYAYALKHLGVMFLLTDLFQPSMMAFMNNANEDICHILEEIGVLLELRGETPFKSRAYFQAIERIRELDVPVSELVEQGTLSSLKGFGKALTQKVTELVETGSLAYHERLKADTPPGLYEIAALPGLDRRKTGVLFLKLGISCLADLHQACLENRVAPLRGFNRQLQQQMLETLEGE